MINAMNMFRLQVARRIKAARIEAGYETPEDSPLGGMRQNMFESQSFPVSAKELELVSETFHKPLDYFLGPFNTEGEAQFHFHITERDTTDEV